MSTLEYSNTHWAMEIQYDSDSILSIIERPVKSFISNIFDLHEKVKLASFSLTKNGNEYNYSFVSQDGRQWNQLIKNQNGYRMTFDVPDYWLLDEFALHREPRLQVINLIEKYNLQKIEITFN